MQFPEPPREQQDELHQSVLEGSRTAFAKLCELALDHLRHFLTTIFPQVDIHILDTVAADLLLAYEKNPIIYDPSRASLFTYLRMAARDDVRNALDKQTRRQKRLTSLDDATVELPASGRYNVQNIFELEDLVSQYTDRSPQEIIDQLMNSLNETDQELVMLLAEGVRETERYAEAMGITHMSVEEQRQEVKRAKDRLKKHIKRFRVT
jgi:RNA polymerase sigma factor (sigma-70 family)